MRPSRFIGSALFICLLGLTSCSSTSNPAPANIWVVAWGDSPDNATVSATNPGGTEQTFRSFFYPTVPGNMERIRFSNYFGTAPVTIGAARLAIATTPPAVDSAHDVPLTFNGGASVTIAPGAEVMSDTVSLRYGFGQKMAVTAYVRALFQPSPSTIPR